MQGIISEYQREKENFKSMHKMEQHKLRYEIDHLNRKMECEQHLSKELTLVNDKLMRDKSNIVSKFQIDDIQRDAYTRGDVATFGVRPSDFLTMNGIPIVQGINDPTLGEEYIARQKAWNDLDNESRDAKRNINKIGLATNPERIYQPTYNIEYQQTPFDNQSSDDNDRDVNYKEDRFNNYSPGKDEIREESKAPAEQKKTIKDSQALRNQLEKMDRDREDSEQKAKREMDQRKRDADEQLRKEKERRDKELKDKEIREKERLDNIRKENERKEKERKEKEKEEEQKKATPVTQPMSSSLKNPFAKKMGGGNSTISQPKKADPAPPSYTNESHHLDSKSKGLKTNSDDIDEDIQDYYSDGFDF